MARSLFPTSPFVNARGLLLAGFLCLALQAQDGKWIGTWATAPVPAHVGNAGAVDETLREIVHVSVGSNQFLRVTLTNEFGVEPLTIGAAGAAIRTGGNEIGKQVALTFGGKPGIVIPPGQFATSDAMNFTFPPLSDLAISLFLPAQTITSVTQHAFADQVSFVALDNQVQAAALPQAREIASWRFLKNVQVEEGPGDGAIVCFGDSITDGAHSTRDADARWPDVLAARLQAEKKTRGLGVLNEGIGGNRILHEGTGPSALVRFDRDVLAAPGVKYVVMLEGINDIGHSAGPNKNSDVVSAEDLIAGYTTLARKAHAQHLKIYGATLTPYMGATYSSPAGEAMRQALNQWIRTTKELDGVIDFDKVTRDPANPAMFLPADDSGDHLHPGDAGYKAMGESIDLKLFER